MLQNQILLIYTLILLLQNSRCQVYFYDFFFANPISSSEGWTVTNGGAGISNFVSTCGTDSIFGGYGKFQANTYITIPVNLMWKPGKKYQFDLYFQNTLNEVGQIYILRQGADETKDLLIARHDISISNSDINPCPGWPTGKIISITGTVYEQSTIFTLKIKTTQGSWGIKNFQFEVIDNPIILNNCHSTCESQYCIGSGELDCVQCKWDANKQFINFQCLCSDLSLYHNAGSCIARLPNCLENDNQFCYQCQDNYYKTRIVGKWQDVCSPCPANCIEICSQDNTQNVVCQSCPTNTVFNTATKTCDCPELYTIIQTGECVPCQTPCEQCIDEPTKCISCNGVYNLIGNYCDPFSAPLVCASPCLTCQTQDYQCLSCIDATYTLVGNTCNSNLVCTPPCLTCAGTVTSCLSCVNDTYSLNGNVCSPCTSPCRTCSVTTTTCLTCIDSTYSQVGNTCTPILVCTPPCLTCSGTSTTCLSCIDSTYGLSGNVCVLCISPCKTCLATATTCMSCIDSTYILLGNACVPCTTPCKTCLGLATSCISCIDSTFTLSGITCIQNLVCTPPCKTCSGLSTSCLTCIDNTYNLVGNTCILTCTSPCKTCSIKATSCLTCLDNTYQLVGDTCAPLICLKPCLTCTGVETSCLSCIDVTLYDLVGTTCIPKLTCSSPCQTCQDSATNCLSCIDQYELQNGTNQCIKTKICQPPCKTCVEGTETKCTSCIDPFYFKPKTYQCLSSQMCFSGFYQDQELHQCIPCHSVCKSCNGPGNNNCLSCFQQQHLRIFVPSNSTCVCASEEFEEFVDTNVQPRCRCQISYYGFETKCLKCNSTCYQCTGEGPKNCTSCLKRDFRILSTNNTCDCENELYQDKNEKCQKIVLSAAAGAVATGQVATGAVGVSFLPMIFMNPVLFLQLMDVLQLVQYIQYIDVQFPSLVEDFFNLLGPFDLAFLPDIIPNYLGNMDSPKAFFKNGVDSLFLRNSQQYIVSILMLSVFYAMLKGCQRLLQKQGEKPDDTSQISKLLDLIIGNFEYGAFLGMIESGFLNLSVFCMLQLKNSSTYLTLQVISYIFSFLVFSLAVVTPILVLNGAYNYMNLKQLTSDADQQESKGEVEQYEQQFGILIDAFEKETLLQTGFFSIILGRQMLMGLTLVFAYKSPLFVISSLVLLNFIVFYQIISKKPYSDKALYYRDLICQFLLFMLHFWCYLFYARNSINTDDYNNLSWPFIIFIALILLVQFVIILKEYKELCHKLSEIIFKQKNNKGDNQNKQKENDLSIQKSNQTSNTEIFVDDLNDLARHQTVTGVQGSAQGLLHNKKPNSPGTNQMGISPPSRTLQNSNQLEIKQLSAKKQFTQSSFYDIHDKSQDGLQQSKILSEDTFDSSPSKGLALENISGFTLQKTPTLDDNDDLNFMKPSGDTNDHNFQFESF